MLRCSIAGALVFFLFYINDRITTADRARFRVLYAKLKLPYGFAPSVIILDVGDTIDLLLAWGPIVIAGLLTYLLFSLPKGSANKLRSIRHKAATVLSYPLGPRSLWNWWCGGVCVGELLAVATFLTFLTFYFTHYMFFHIKRVNAAEAAGVALPYSRNIVLLDRAAISIGQTIQPCLLLLFLPLPQNSFLNCFTGIPFVSMIRYHRWLGHVTLWVTTLHGSCYYVYWSSTAGFWYNFTDWSTIHNNSNLCGSLAFFCVLPLWISSTSFLRRKFFEAFYRFHIVGFVSYFIFSQMHYHNLWHSWLPGLFLYTADLVFRCGQYGNVTLVSEARVCQEGSMVSLKLQTDKKVPRCPLTVVWAVLPSISRWQWHVFSLGSTEGKPGEDGSMTLHIKREGAWTKELIAQIQEGGRPIPVRVSGPIGVDDCSWKEYSVVVLIAGGSGVVPLLCMLTDMVKNWQQLQKADSAEASSRVAGLPSKVYFVWTCRGTSMFTLLDQDVISAAMDPIRWLDTRLHSTAPSNGSQAASPAMDAKLAAMINPDGSAGSKPGRIKHASSYGWSLARKVQPRSLGLWHEAIVLLLAAVGAFFGIYLAATWFAEVKAAGKTTTKAMAWKLGLLYALLSAVGALGLPYMLAIFPVHLYRYAKDSRSVAQGEDEGPFGVAGVPVVTLQPSVVAKGQLSMPEAGLHLHISPGRPDIRATLDHILAAHTGTKSIGVYISGPTSLVNSATTICASLNDTRAVKTYLEVHKETFEL
ncbi:hypothetical protein WJX72_005103 [[Myrmecia] bisecta]|uniref:FAD-binding FR-type domain-containing protein n=1 Tax=[Myrmecia] bisecta TaxID=41462 RepID=A0AAW1QQL3_9CHLO